MLEKWLAVVACVPLEWKVEANVTVTVPEASADVRMVSKSPALPAALGVSVLVADVPLTPAMMCEDFVTSIVIAEP